MSTVNRRSLRYTYSALRRVVSLCESTELRSKWLKAFDANDHASLPSEIDILSYSDWQTFMHDYLIVEFSSKFDSWDLAVNREEVAVAKFLESEEACRLTNRKFAKLDGSVFSFSDPLLSVLYGARRKIERLLSTFSWDESFAFMGFGPGASVGIPRVRSHSLNKIGHSRPTATGECAALGPALFRALPQWRKAIAPDRGGEPEIDIVSGNRITTVPKNSKTNRVIAIEPLLNMFIQKGIGGVIRRRLKRVGVDLDSQLRNQDLARRGSLDGSLATIDLSSASDSISLGLVEWLLPPDWVMAMKICRSPVGVLPSGASFRYQKVSSMGNGFTFELQSLIFWALCSEAILACGGSVHDLAVYGDDLIVPVGSVDLVASVLGFCGFTFNGKKSFWSGPFRESCGKHYFQGRDVTPFYIRKDVESVQRQLWLANTVRRWSSRFKGEAFGCNSMLRPLYLDTLRRLPVWARRLSIPEGFGDGGLVRDFDEARPGRHRFFDAYVTTHLTRSFTGPLPEGQAALHLSLMKLERAPLILQGFPERLVRLSGMQFNTGLPRPEGVDIGRIPTRYRDKVVKLVVPQWEGLGPWDPVC